MSDILPTLGSDANGEAFHPSLDGARAPAVIALESTLNESTLVGTVQGQAFRLPLSDLQAEITGVDFEAIRFTHSSEPDLTLVLRDLTLAKSGPLSEVPSVQAAFSKSRAYVRRLWGCRLTALFVAAAFATILIAAGVVAIAWIRTLL